MRTTKPRNYNNKLCRTVPIQPCLYPDGVISTDELKARTIGRQGRKPTYPQCKLHGKNVYTWANGHPTAAAPGYDNRERMAKARARVNEAGGSRRAKNEPASDFNLANEEDGEFEYESDYGPIIKPGGSHSPPAAIWVEEEEDGVIYIDESSSWPPALGRDRETQPSEQQAAPLTDVLGGSQTVLRFAPRCGVKRSRSALEEVLDDMPPPEELSIEEKVDIWHQYGEVPSWFSEGTQPPKKYVAPSEIMREDLRPAALPAPCVGLKRALEEADIPLPKRSSLENTMDKPLSGYDDIQPVDTSELFYRQEFEKNSWSESDFALEPGMRSRRIRHEARKASINNSLRLAAPTAPHRLGDLRT